MGLTLEWIRPDVAIARAGVNHFVFGDHYDMACVVDIQGKVAYIKACVGNGLNAKIVRTIINEIRAHGIKAIRWERRKRGLKKVIICERDYE